MTGARAAYRPAPWVVAALALASVVLTALAVSSPGAERFLFAVPALAVGAEALRSAVLGPTLVTDDDGIEVLAGLRRQRHPWSSVVSIGAMSPPSSGGRLRRSANALEIDLGDRLILIHGYRLGVPVAQVTAAIATSGRLAGTTGGF